MQVLPVLWKEDSKSRMSVDLAAGGTKRSNERLFKLLEERRLDVLLDGVGVRGAASCFFGAVNLADKDLWSFMGMPLGLVWRGRNRNSILSSPSEKALTEGPPLCNEDGKYEDVARPLSLGYFRSGNRDKSSCSVRLIDLSE